MKRTLLTIMVMIFAVSLFAQATQRGGHREFRPEEMAARQADNLKKELALTDPQYKTIYDLYLKRGEEMKARREKKDAGQQMSREARQEEMKKSQEAMDAELKKVLTPDQYAKYTKWQKVQQERRRQGGTRGGDRPSHSR